MQCSDSADVECELCPIPGEIPISMRGSAVPFALNSNRAPVVIVVKSPKQYFSSSSSASPTKKRVLCHRDESLTVRGVVVNEKEENNSCLPRLW